MKKTLILLLVSVILIASVYAEKGDRKVTAGIGFANPTYDYRYGDGDYLLQGSGFTMSIGYSEEVLKNVLLLGRVSFIGGKVASLEGTVGGAGYSLNGKLQALDSLIGICYQFTIKDRVTISAGLGFSEHSAHIHSLEAQSSTSDIFIGSVSSVNPFVAIIAGLGYLVNENLSINIDLGGNLTVGIVLTAGVGYKL